MEAVRDESAQAIILAGFTVAIGLVVLATLMNAMLFSSNLDARGVHVPSDEIAEVTQLTQEEQEFLMDRVQGFNNTPSEAESYYTSAMRNHTDSIQLLPSSESSVVTTTGFENQTAWQVVQNDTSNQLIAADGDADWQVATDVDETYVLDLNITLDDGFSTANDNLTRIELRDTSGDQKWAMYVVDESNQPDSLNHSFANDTVVVEDTTEGAIEEAYNSTEWSFGPDDPLQIEVFANGSAARIDNETYDAVDNLYFPDPSNYDTIAVEWGNSTQGEYEFRFNGTASGLGPCSPDTCRTGTGWSTGVVHNSTFTFTYVHPNVAHVDNMTRVQPRELVR